MQLYLLKYLVLVQAALFLGNILKAPTRQVLRNIPGCEMNWEGCFLLHQVSTFNFQHGGFGSQGFQNFMVLICHLVITECYFHKIYLSFPNALQISNILLTLTKKTMQI